MTVTLPAWLATLFVLLFVLLLVLLLAVIYYGYKFFRAMCEGLVEENRELSRASVKF